MPWNRHNYPDNWTEISDQERESAGNRCRRCGAQKHWYSWRDPAHLDDQVFSETPARPDTVPANWIGPTFIVLSVGHVDQNPQNNHPDNLRCWCRRCHLNHDRPWNLDKMARKRAIAAGQFALRF